MFTGKKRVALTTLLHLKHLSGRTSGEGIPTDTNYLGISKILGMNLFLHLACVDAHFPFILCHWLKFNDTINQSKQSIIPANTNVATRMNSCATLPD